MTVKVTNGYIHEFSTPTHFRSHDLMNIIFGKTAITPSFLKLKISSKTKMNLDVISSDPNHKKRYVP